MLVLWGLILFQFLIISLRHPQEVDDHSHISILATREIRLFR